MGAIRSFEDLHAWQLARELRSSIYRASKTFPECEKYALTDQIRRAAVSVTANIAEGYGRFHYQENLQFCRQARGSLYETIDHLIAANDLGYLPDPLFTELKSSAYRCLKMLNGYIAATQRLAKQSSTKP